MRPALYYGLAPVSRQHQIDASVSGPTVTAKYSYINSQTMNVLPRALT